MIISRQAVDEAGTGVDVAAPVAPVAAGEDEDDDDDSDELDLGDDDDDSAEDDDDDADEDDDDEEDIIGKWSFRRVGKGSCYPLQARFSCS